MSEPFTRDEAKTAVWAQVEDLDSEDQITALEEVIADMRRDYHIPGRYIDFVFDGGPGPRPGRFVEVEDLDGRSISIGRWIDRKNGLWALRIPLGVGH